MRKKASLLFLLKLLKIPLNLFLLFLTAKYFGVSIEKDIWLLSFATMMVLDSAIWGPINETFRSRFIFIKDENSEKFAIRQTQSLLTYFLLFSILISVIVVILARIIAEFIAPQYNDIQIEFLIQMIYWTVPVLLLNQTMQIGISILNAYNIFYVGEISGFVSTVGNIILIYLFATKFGIFSLAVAYYIATILLILFIVFFIIKTKIPLFKKNWSIEFSGFKGFFLFAIPFFLPYFFGQINGLVEKILAGKLDAGTVSILDFSNRIPNMMFGIIISIITTLLVPILSKAFINKEKKIFNTEFQNMFRLGILVVGFIAVFVLANAESIVQILYGSGSISERDLALIANVSIFYSFTLFGVFSYIIFGMSLLSSKKEKNYAFLGMLTQIGVICLNFLFYRWLTVYIFPLSIFISHSIFAYLMYRQFPFKDSVELNMVKYLIIIVPIAGFVFVLKQYLIFINPYVSIIIFTSILTILFGLFAFLTNIEEKKTLFALMRRINSKK